MIHLALMLLLFSGADYVGYNATKHDPHGALIAYRIVQFTAQAAITVYLVRDAGWKQGLRFNLIWWTFGADWLYYGWANLLNPGHGWEARGSPKTNRITWAYWTPLGLFAPRGAEIPTSALAAQSIIGLTISVIL